MFYKNTCSNDLLVLLKEIQNNELFKNYLLVGGTSLSLQIGHRMSVDIDLFTLNEQDNDEILRYLKENFNNIETINNKKNILQVKVNDIKIDFVKATGKLIKEPIYEDGLKLCHKEDIAGMKLNAINSDTGRRRAKDYVDIAYLIEDLTLGKMFDIYKWKFDKSDVYNVKKDLSEVYKVNPYEWQEIIMIRKDILVSEVPRIIKNAIEEYNKKNKLTFKESFINKLFKNWKIK